jgi:hypothetical protein
MKSHRGGFLREIFAFTLIAFSSASANAALYTFSQDGFSVAEPLPVALKLWILTTMG